MSAILNGPAGEGAPRALMIGRSRDVMDVVLQELGDAGISAAGTIDPEQAAAAFNANGYELIAFGGGLKDDLKETLKATFRRQSARAKFLDTHATVAAHEIITALEASAPEPAIDLDAYFARIGYRGPRTPTLGTLRELCQLHPAAIAFEAIDVLLGKGVDISPGAVDAKLIGQRRGGYCFEQNSLLQRALEAIGFKVEMLLARVHLMSPAGAPLPVRSHLALRVTIDDTPWLVDGGFGGYMPTAPLRMDIAEPQATAHETYRLIPFGGPLLLQMRQEGRWQSLYTLSLEAQHPVDLQAPNWFTATYPGSLFKQTLMVARSTPTARYRLLNNRLTIQTGRGELERRSLDSKEIERVLAENFELPVEASWRPVIERAAAMEAAA